MEFVVRHTAILQDILGDVDLERALQQSRDSFDAEQCDREVPGPIQDARERAEIKAAVNERRRQMHRSERIDQLQGMLAKGVCSARLLPFLTQAGRVRRNLSVEQEDSAREVLGGSCPVCLEPGLRRVDIVQQRCCENTIHAACVLEWVDKGHDDCPICRAPLMPLKTAQ
jgi:hypothetical protein